MPPEQHLLEWTGGEPGGLCTLLTYCREILGHLIHTMTESSGILHIMATIHFIYALRMSREGEEAREPRKGRGEMSGDLKNKVQARWRCYFWMSLFLRTINPLIRWSQASSRRRREHARRCGRRGAQRGGAVKSIILGKLICLIRG